MVKQTDDEWFLEMMQLFHDIRKATFECPQCGNEQSFEDFIHLGLDPLHAYRDCIGIYLNELGCQFTVDKNTDFNQVKLIILPDGRELKVFHLFDR
ncbi:VVA0879 family protein [Laceyella tengchongensis]|uniref:VVA0879 family protein n=1 Tax=Laceyella tengchongensis TaxID=574699 RepID=UPI000F513BAC|nr:VVA0879 family protein [Laceyella tengchongensis]